MVDAGYLEWFVADTGINAALIEKTIGGDWLDEHQVFRRDDPLRLEDDGRWRDGGQDEANAIWVRASEKYASGVAQPGRPVVAFVHGARPDGV